ncbi:MAG: hypothetical protein HYU54_05650, partial [Actinobacteria bacterium]|nr:hypothetical protein [Actinomycetota bacterium]
MLVEGGPDEPPEEPDDPPLDGAYTYCTGCELGAWWITTRRVIFRTMTTRGFRSVAAVAGLGDEPSTAHG